MFQLKLESCSWLSQCWEMVCFPNGPIPGDQCVPSPPMQIPAYMLHCFGVRTLDHLNGKRHHINPGHFFLLSMQSNQRILSQISNLLYMLNCIYISNLYLIISPTNDSIKWEGPCNPQWAIYVSHVPDFPRVEPHREKWGAPPFLLSRPFYRQARNLFPRATLGPAVSLNLHPGPQCVSLNSSNWCSFSMWVPNFVWIFLLIPEILLEYQRKL